MPRYLVKHSDVSLRVSLDETQQNHSILNKTDCFSNMDVCVHVFVCSVASDFFFRPGTADYWAFFVHAIFQPKILE